MTGNNSNTKQEIIHHERGGVRETSYGKGLYQYMSFVGLKRLAQRYEYGMRKYGASDDYKRGLPTGDCMDSIQRHWNDYMSGDNSEDHMAAIAWNAFCVMEMEVNRPSFQTVRSRKRHKPIDCINYSLPESTKGD